jgi:hypothetical protein
MQLHLKIKLEKIIDQMNITLTRLQFSQLFDKFVKVCQTTSSDFLISNMMISNCL